MLRRYAQQQEGRQAEIQAKKSEAEAAREEIFQKLKGEEEKRRAESEYIENLRNDLYMQELEEQARQREREEIEKREKIRHDLLAAKAYQERLKEERQAEERRMEDEFKAKLSQKFAEDERLEQMNA